MWGFICQKWAGVDKRIKVTFLSTFFWGLIAHIYMMTNKLPNHDDLYALDGYGMSSSLGRWTLARLGNFAMKVNVCFSLPWVNGLISILLIAVSACMVVSLFKIQSAGIGMLIGGLMVTLPAWTFTFFFMFTAPYYAIALILSVACVWITDKYRFGWVAGMIFMIMAVGIYQSYIAMGSILVVAFFIRMLIENEKLSKEHYIKAVKMIVMLVGAMAAYIASLKLYETIPGHDLEEYKGISDIATGNGSMLSRLPERVGVIYAYFASLFINDRLEMTPYKTVNVLLALMFVIAVVLMIVLLKKNKCGIVNIVLAAICFILIPVCTLPLYLVVSDVNDVYSLMLYSVVGVYIFVLAVADMTGRDISLFSKCAEWFTEIACLIIIVIYSFFANAQYLAADMSIREAESYYTTMITSIKMQEGYHDDMKVVIVGSTITDASVYENEKMSFLANSARPESLVNAYSRQKLMEDYLGFKNECVYATSEIAAGYASELSTMECYPDSGSIRIVNGDTVLVKLE